MVYQKGPEELLQNNWITGLQKNSFSLIAATSFSGQIFKNWSLLSQFTCGKKNSNNSTEVYCLSVENHGMLARICVEGVGNVSEQVWKIFSFFSNVDKCITLRDIVENCLSF